MGIAHERSLTFADKQAMSVISCVLDGFLFVSGQMGTKSRRALAEVGITHILNCCDRIKSRFTKSIKYKILHIHDTQDTNARAYFDEALSFMDSARAAGGRVLVHCLVGASRSVTMCLAYMIARENMALRD